MKNLLGNRFVPLTFQIGFLEASLERVLEVFLQWESEIGRQFGRQPEHEFRLEALPETLARLTPLTTPPNKVLLMETHSQWTAYFDNGLRTSDPESPVGHLCTIIPCRGMVAHCVPDRSKSNHPEAIRIYGNVSFRLFTTHKTDWLNQERAIVAMNDGGDWIFSAEGREQPFEEPEKYKARSVANRFTCEMLERYCEAFGINLFDENFYADRGAIVHTIQKLPNNAPIMSLEEANHRSLLK